MIIMTMCILIKIWSRKVQRFKLLKGGFIKRMMISVVGINEFWKMKVMNIMKLKVQSMYLSLKHLTQNLAMKMSMKILNEFSLKIFCCQNMFYGTTKTAWIKNHCLINLWIINNFSFLKLWFWMKRKEMGICIQLSKRFRRKSETGIAFLLSIFGFSKNTKFITSNTEINTETDINSKWLKMKIWFKSKT